MPKAAGALYKIACNDENKKAIAAANGSTAAVGKEAFCGDAKEVMDLLLASQQGALFTNVARGAPRTDARPCASL